MEKTNKQPEKKEKQKTPIFGVLEDEDTGRDQQEQIEIEKIDAENKVKLYWENNQLTFSFLH